MFQFFARKYEKVEQLNEISDDATNNLLRDTVKCKDRSFRAAYLPWLLHFVVIISYSIFIFAKHLNTEKCSPCFSGEDHKCFPSKLLVYVSNR
jgi:hypothetical protein